MPHNEDHFATADGVRLLENVWRPATDPLGIVVFVHGFAEHSGRYAELAARLTEHGLAVYAMDLRGHGRSGGDQVFVRSFEQYLEDVRLQLERVGRREPGKPRFALGHSMGGQIVALLAIRRELGAAGMILSAPAVKISRSVFPMLRRLAPWVGRWLPRLRIVRVSSQGLSRDPEVVAQFEADPLVFHGRFPVRSGAEILRAGKEIQAGMDSIRLPLLIVQGGEDRIVDPEGSRELYARAGTPDKTLRVYEGLYHDLFHEPEHEQVTAELIAWIEERLGLPQAQAATLQSSGASLKP